MPSSREISRYKKSRRSPTKPKVIKHVRYRKSKSKKSFVTTGEELVQLPVQRGSIIPYTMIGREIYVLLGMDLQSGDVTDFGGGVKKGENGCTAGLRELEEETSGYLTQSEVLAPWSIPTTDAIEGENTEREDAERENAEREDVAGEEMMVEETLAKCVSICDERQIMGSMFVPVKPEKYFDGIMPLPLNNEIRELVWWKWGDFRRLCLEKPVCKPSFQRADESSTNSSVSSTLSATSTNSSSDAESILYTQPTLGTTGIEGSVGKLTSYAVKLWTRLIPFYYPTLHTDFKKLLVLAFNEYFAVADALL